MINFSNKYEKFLYYGGSLKNLIFRGGNEKLIDRRIA